MGTVTSSAFTIIVNKSAYIDTSIIKVVRGTTDLIAVDSNPTTGQFSFSITSCTGCSAEKVDVNTVGIVSVTAGVATVEISINAENINTYAKQITVGKVKPGEKGQSLTKSTPQWYASTSKTSPTGGKWVESMPTIDASHYLWLRYKLDWENPTATTYTTPTLEQIAESVKEVSAKQSEFKQDLDGFKMTVSNTYQKKEDMTNYTTTSQMLSAIDQKANQINMTVSSTYATKHAVEDLNENLTTNYSTTQQMNSAINQKADSIISTVSSTYATTQSTSTLLKESITEYYLSTSNTTLSGGAWDTTPYTPTPGKYIWQRTRTVTNAGEIKYSNPICVSDEAYSVMMTSDVLLLKCNSDGQVI